MDIFQYFILIMLLALYPSYMYSYWFDVLGSLHWNFSSKFEKPGNYFFKCIFFFPIFWLILLRLHLCIGLLALISHVTQTLILVIFLFYLRLGKFKNGFQCYLSVLLIAEIWEYTLPGTLSLYILHLLLQKCSLLKISFFLFYHCDNISIVLGHIHNRYLLISMPESFWCMFYWLLFSPWLLIKFPCFFA